MRRAALVSLLCVALCATAFADVLDDARIATRERRFEDAAKVIAEIEKTWMDK